MTSFDDKCPKTIQDLHDEILNGNDTYLSKLQYFSKSIKGSNSYWRAKRAELYTWIEHHIDKGSGPPNLFITLSCAEYHWPDIMRLLKDRYYSATGIVIEPEETFATKNMLINDYSIVIQEYFQARVEIFLETVGKSVLGIEHYWVRYEFAKSRGQIHAHLLAICNKKVQEGILGPLATFRHNKEKQAKSVEEFVSKTFGLTAIHPASDCEGKLKVELVGPPEGTATVGTSCSKYFSDILDEDKDVLDLVNTAQMHTCSSYCLRDIKGKKG